MADTPISPNSSLCSGGDACSSGHGVPRARVQREASALAEAAEPLRAVFMGTPGFAAAILERVLACPFIRVCAVYSQPDRPAGRGRQLKAPEVKQLALERGLPVLQPLNFKNTPEGDAAVAELAAFCPDVLIVAAYGLILPQRVLDIPRLMPVNVHASLLPKYRGAAPIQRAIMNGDAVTGVTIMRMEAGMDTGAILMQRAVGIGLGDTSADLHDELAREGADLLIMALERLAAGSLASIPQDGARATHAPKLRKEEGFVDLALPARALHARIRGLTPWPGATLVLRRPGHDDLHVAAAPGEYPFASAGQSAGPSEAAGQGTPGPGGIPGCSGNALLVRCGDGVYAFTSLRPAGRGGMDGAAFYNGYVASCPEARFV